MTNIVDFRSRKPVDVSEMEHRFDSMNGELESCVDDLLSLIEKWRESGKRADLCCIALLQSGYDLTFELSPNFEAAQELINMVLERD